MCGTPVWETQLHCFGGAALPGRALARKVTPVQVARYSLGKCPTFWEEHFVGTTGPESTSCGKDQRNFEQGMIILCTALFPEIQIVPL